MSQEITFQFRALANGAGGGTLSSVPRHSGVFRIFDSHGTLLLLEKTHNLALRLRRFYSEDPEPGALDLRQIGERIEFCPTDSPFESLYLLYLERRRLFPGTYRRMKTFPLYHLLAIDPRLRFPRIDISRDVGEGVRYFGPFRSRKTAEQIRSMIERTFGVRSCEYDIQGDLAYPDCLYFQMQTCSRPCNGDIDRDSYMRDVSSAIALVEGDIDKGLQPLLIRIATLADETRFEQAELLRLQMEKARKARLEVKNPLFEVGQFNFVVVMNSGSTKYRKVAFIRAGRVRRLEIHPVASIGDTLARSLATLDETTQPVPSRTSFVYDEFCIAADFLSRPLRSVRFFPYRSPEETADEIATVLQSGDASAGSKSTPVSPV